MTGSMPGMAASTSDTWLLGEPPNAVEAPENNLALEATWACTSMPITTSQSPVTPLIRLRSPLFAVSCITIPMPPCSAQVVLSHIPHPLPSPPRRQIAGQLVLFLPFRAEICVASATCGAPDTSPQFLYVRLKSHSKRIRADHDPALSRDRRCPAVWHRRKRWSHQ